SLSGDEGRGKGSTPDRLQLRRDRRRLGDREDDGVPPPPRSPAALSGGDRAAGNDPSRGMRSVRVRWPNRAQTSVGRSRAAVPLAVAPDRDRAAAREGGVGGVPEPTGPDATSE